MERKLIDRYITLPMAINVLKQSQDYFSKFKMGNIYLDWLDAAIDKASEDFYELKSDMISKYHLDVKRIGQTTYSVNREVIEYSAEELKELTRKIMEYYLKSSEVFRKSRLWKPLD